jgi:hypothetical protein
VSLAKEDLLTLLNYYHAWWNHLVNNKLGWWMQLVYISLHEIKIYNTIS